MKDKLVELMAWVRGLRNVRSLRSFVWHLRQIVRIVWWNERGSTAIKSALCIPLALGGLVFVVNNIAHGNSRHAEASVVRELFKSHYGNDVELYFSIARGTVLSLVRTENEQYSGIVWRVTENAGQRWLDSECYECTAFIRQMYYWRKVIKRDGYVPLAAYPSIQRQYHNWITAQLGDW